MTKVLGLRIPSRDTYSQTCTCRRHTYVSHLSDPNIEKRTHIHIHTHIFTYTYIYIFIYIHTHIHKHTHEKNTNTNAHPRAEISTHLHTNTHAHTHPTTQGRVLNTGHKPLITHSEIKLGQNPCAQPTRETVLASSSASFHIDVLACGKLEIHAYK